MRETKQNDELNETKRRMKKEDWKHGNIVGRGKRDRETKIKRKRGNRQWRNDSTRRAQQVSIMVL